MEVIKNICEDERREISIVLLKCKKYDLALSVLDELRLDYPKDIELLFDISKVYEKKEMFDEALRYLKLARGINRANGEAYFKIATIYKALNDTKKCYENLNEALEKGYLSENVFIYKALLLEEKGEYDEALSYYEKALIKDKFNMLAKYRMYKIYLTFNRYDEGEKVLDKMIRVNADCYDGYHLKFTLMINTGKLLKAYEILIKAKEIFGEEDLVKLDYIRYYIIQKDYDKANEIIDGIEYESDYYVDFMVQKSKIYITKNQFKEALAILTTIYDSENGEIIFLNGISKLLSNDLKGAIKEFDTINDMEGVEHYKNATVFLKGFIMKSLSGDAQVLDYFSQVNAKYKFKTISNPYDINYKVFRILALIECRRYEDAHKLIKAVEKLEVIEKTTLEFLKNIIIDRKNGKDESLNIYRKIFM